jgi:hypothetical protein
MAGCLPGPNKGWSRPDSRGTATALEGISVTKEAFLIPHDARTRAYCSRKHPVAHRVRDRSDRWVRTIRYGLMTRLHTLNGNNKGA